MKTTTEYKLDHGRLLTRGEAPLYLRVEMEDGQVTRTTLGIERKGGISWQLSLHPSAFAWAGNLVTQSAAAGLHVPDGTEVDTP
jgi:hypothetical protein